MSTAERSTLQVRLLRLGGATAGVLMPLVVMADGLTRPSYDPWRNGVSQLGLGERGWLQTTNFVIGGLLLLGFAVWLRMILRPGPGGTWTPILTAATGIGWIIAGVVPTDPALGYPPGAATTITRAGQVHGLAGILVFLGISAAPFVIARRFSAAGNRGWATYSRVTGTAVAALAVLAGIAYRLDINGTVSPGAAGALETASLLAGFVWTVAIAAVPPTPSAIP